VASPKRIPKAVESAVRAAQIYAGSTACGVRDAQKLYTKMQRAFGGIERKYGTAAVESVQREAQRRGAICPVPGKDI
jgi:hypothetical protein